MWVLKLGGSWIKNPKLKSLIKLINLQKKNVVALVVGGGLFADSVRQAQKYIGFDDSLAHNLALNCTEFYANIIKSFCGKIELVTDPDKLIIGEKLKIWTPYKYLKKKPLIDKNWNSTSDTIACWLARKIEAEGVIIIKSIDFDEDFLKIKYLENKGILDKNVKKYISYDLKLKIVGPEFINILQSKQSWNSIVSNLSEVRL